MATEAPEDMNAGFIEFSMNICTLFIAFAAARLSVIALYEKEIISR
jgi:hypothetical protein